MDDPGQHVTAPDADEVELERDGAVAWVWLARPHRRNAMTYAGWSQLGTCLRGLAESDARAVVLAGRGGDFCTGADLSGPDRRDVPYQQLAMTARVAQALAELPQPTVAMVDGFAVGAGMGLALGCDFVLASERAVLATLFIDRGLTPDMGLSWLLPRLVGHRMAAQLILTPERIGADVAADLGLVTAVHPVESLHDEVAALAARLSAGPPMAMALAKSMLAASTSRTFAEAVEAEAVAQTLNVTSPDAAEGRAAFADRRPPRFGGWPVAGR